MMWTPQALRGLALGCFTIFPAAVAVPSAAASQHPNIVLVLMDNFGWGEVGAYGGGALRGAPTPHIYSLAEEGLRLTNFNVEPECTPSRSSLMTGRYAARTRLRTDGTYRSVWYGITKWEVTIAEMLTETEYATGWFGKWHLGDTEGRYPTGQGFDEWYGIPRSSDRAFWPDSTQYDGEGFPGARFNYVMESTRGEKPKELAVYDRAKRRLIDREITDKTIDFIQRKAAAKKPFFTLVSYTQTHEPVEPHPDYRGRTGHGDFADVLAQTDDYVGDLLDTIDALDIAEDTLFIFTADNGREGIPGSWGFTGPWRGGMFSPWEGSLRVPFLIRWPGKIPSGTVSNDIVHLVDLMPTFAAATHSELPDDRILDGLDQLPFFLGETENSPRESVMVYVGNELFGAKWRNWKILFKDMDTDSYAIRDLAYPSIYNLIVDPKEEVPEGNYLPDTWVDAPLYQVVEDFEASLEADTGAPDD
ncbi:arylsulfatase F [Luminiphilus syltensis NOR5-1B]|uniref:Arylsulfatase F n=2 Tax=Luminiphilus TaxID=1341118 RepID=B8KTJ7_9GAMM|nr:arylsulfatase F [Luminiphilus syltensis NOR5-1B]